MQVVKLDCVTCTFNGGAKLIFITEKLLQPKPILPITEYVPGPTDIEDCVTGEDKVVPLHVYEVAPVALNVEVNPVHTADDVAETINDAPKLTLIVI